MTNMEIFSGIHMIGKIGRSVDWWNSTEAVETKLTEDQTESWSSIPPVMLATRPGQQVYCVAFTGYNPVSWQNWTENVRFTNGFSAYSQVLNVRKH